MRRFIYTIYRELHNRSVSYDMNMLIPVIILLAIGNYFRTCRAIVCRCTGYMHKTPIPIKVSRLGRREGQELEGGPVSGSREHEPRQSINCFSHIVPLHRV
jgi:hypothetical protein